MKTSDTKLFPCILMLLLVSIMIIIPACSEEGAVSEPIGEQEDFRLTGIIEGLAAAGDLSAEAIVASGVLDELEPQNFPLTLYLVNENNIKFGSGSVEGSTKTVFEPGDTALKAYIDSVGLTEETFLSHPKLEQFVKSHLVPTRVTVGGNTASEQQVVASAADSELIITSKGAGEISVNGITLGSPCFVDGSGEAIGLICYPTDVPVEFDWD